VVSRRGDPNILALVCAWHPLTAADNAGEDGCTYSARATVVPVECAGRVTTAALLKALAGRPEGVLVAACGRGDCHYSNGNESCEKVVEETREIMRIAGVDPARLGFDLSSDVDGRRFASLIDGFSEEISKLNGRAAGRAKAARKPARTRSGKRTTKKATPKKKVATKRATGRKKAAAEKSTAKRKTAAKRAPAKKKTAAKSRRAKSTRRT
jgi:F420-non-reducing hydrogenase iron-sulfur subunit